MDLLTHLQRRMAWNAWADLETLASLRAAGKPPEQAVRWMAHVIAVERLWLARVQGVPAPLPVWPSLTATQCVEALDDSIAAWEHFLEVLDPARLAATVRYVNTEGNAFTNTVGDVIAHVITHGAHHRGQIAAALRAAGHEPAYTDFIHAVRTGQIP